MAYGNRWYDTKRQQRIEHARLVEAEKGLRQHEWEQWKRRQWCIWHKRLCEHPRFTQAQLNSLDYLFTWLENQHDDGGEK